MLKTCSPSTGIVRVVWWKMWTWWWRSIDCLEGFWWARCADSTSHSVSVMELCLTTSLCVFRSLSGCASWVLPQWGRLPCLYRSVSTTNSITLLWGIPSIRPWPNWWAAIPHRYFQLKLIMFELCLYSWSGRHCEEPRSGCWGSRSRGSRAAQQPEWVHR